MDKRHWAHIAMVLATLLYSANYRIAKDLMPEPVHPFGFILLRMIVASILLWIMHRIWVREPIEKKDIGLLALCGLCGAALNLLFFFKGLSITTPFSASLIMVMTPAVVLIFSYIRKVERFSWACIMGLAVGFIGYIVLTISDDGSQEGGSIKGNAMVFGNVALYSLYLVLVKPLLARYHPFTVAKWVFFFGAVFTSIVGSKRLMDLPFATLDGPQWGSIVFVVIGATVLTYVLNIAAMKHVKASMVGYYVYLQPVFTALLEVAWGYDKGLLNKLLAAAIMFLGMGIIERYRRKMLRQQKG